MQQLITVSDNNVTDVDNLNIYLEEGWQIASSFPFQGGTNFLIHKRTFPDSTLTLYPGLFYDGTLDIEHNKIPEGSVIITPDSVAYTVKKQQS